MARTKISEFSATPGDNTDIDGIDIAEGCAPSGINNAIRELMAQLKDMQTGASGDTFTLTTVNSTTVDTTNLEATNLKAKDGTAAGSIADSTGVVTLGSSVLTTTDINGGTIDNASIGATTPSTVVATQVDITAQGDLRLQDTTGGQYVALQAPGTVATSYTLTLPVDDGTAGQALITDGSGVLSWSSAASGDVYGPASATDNAVARYDGTTGKIIQNSAVTIGDDGATVIAVNSSSDGLRITQTGAGNALLVEDSANPDATPMVIDASGRVVVGDTQIRTGVYSTISSLSVIGTTLGSSTASLYDYANNSFTGPGFLTQKSKSGTIGTQGIVASGDRLFLGTFSGSDGTAFIPAASIEAWVDGTPGTNDMPGRLVFSTTADGASSPTERMRIDNQGRVGVGGAANSLTAFNVSKSITGGTSAWSNYANGSILSDVTAAATLYGTSAATQATSFTLTALNHFSASQGTFGASSTVTNQYGFAVQSNLTGATNNYGFYGDIASGTGRYNFYAAGTASNYFAGSTFIGGLLGGDTKFAIGGTLPSSGTGSYAARVIATIPSTSTGGAIGFDTNLSTQAAAFTLAVLNHFNASQGTIGAGSTVTNQYGFNASSTLTGATNNYGFYGNIASGTGRWNFYAAGTAANVFAGTTSIGGVVGAESLRVTPVASAVNYLDARGGTTGGSPYIMSNGSDTNVGLNLTTKGASNIGFSTNNFGSSAFVIAHVASAVNYLQVTGGTTGNAATLGAVGSDTNIDLRLNPKGTGVLKFGTYTAGILAQAGYIQIKDAAGNTRNLLVG